MCVCVSQLWPSSSLNSPVHLSCPSGSSSLVEGLIRLLPVVDYFHFVIQSHYCRSGHVLSLIGDLLTAGAPTQKVGTMLKALEWMCWHMTDDCSLKKYFPIFSYDDVRLSITLVSQYSCHRIIMKFSGDMASDKYDVHAGQGQRSKVKGSKQILSQFGHFQTITLLWIHRLQNSTQTLKWSRRGAFLFFKVICQISRSHRTWNCHFWPKLIVSRMWLQFEWTDGYETMHKAWCGIDDVLCWFSKVIYQISRTQAEKFHDLALIGVFLDDNSILNSWWPWNDKYSL